MKFWFDILTPKQLLLFTSLAEILLKEGHEVFLTSRSYEQLNDFLDGYFGEWGIRRYGRFGGARLDEKLRASIERLGELLTPILEEKPDVAISSGSPEASRIAYGLGFPHILISDSPHSPVNPLSAPLSVKVLTPWIIPIEEWGKSGARRVKKYRALDPYFWLRNFEPSRELLEELGLREREYVLLRLPESYAAYLKISDEELLEELRSLPELLSPLKLVVMTRYRRQRELAEKILGSETIILSKLVPGASLIYYSDFFVGGGGTMTQEAAMLGVPAYSIYPGKLPTVLRFLVKRGLVRRFKRVSSFLKNVPRIIRNADELRRDAGKKSRRLWELMRNPEKEVVRELIFTGSR